MAYNKPERWKKIPGYERYEASTLGRIASLIGTRKILRPCPNHNGYLGIYLSKGHCDSKHFLVHRLVLLTFRGPCPEGMESRHKNGERACNFVSNLCWGTHRTNIRDKIEHGTQHYGARHHVAKLTDEDARWVVAWRKSGFSYQTVGETFNVSRGTIMKICCGQSNFKVVAIGEKKRDQISRDVVGRSVPRGEQHHRAKLTGDDIPFIRAFIKSRFGLRDIGLAFGVTRETINKIKFRKSWKHVA